jgi:hypothetical protein
MPTTRTIKAEKAKKKATPKKQPVDNGDTVQWQIDSITSQERLHAVSTDSHLTFDIFGSLGVSTIGKALGYATGTTTVTYEVPYSLSLENTTTGTSTTIDDGSGGGVYLVIDTLPDPGPGGGDGNGDGDQGQGGREGQG